MQGRGWELLVLDCSAYFCFPSLRLLSSVEFLCFACNNDGCLFSRSCLMVVFCKSYVPAIVLTCDGGLIGN